MDGIRAFAVLAVIMFHAGVSWVGGGLLGVDVFFVLSGFLITSLICRELVASNTVRLTKFWAQRARRLLPALFVVLLGIAVYLHVFASSVDLDSVRTDALATLAYVSNWHFVISDQGYFAQAAAPSPLLHTWSLAVEEQYYLVWPLLALLVVRRWGIQKLAFAAAVGALGSAVLMSAMYGAGFSIDRLYYGTDTRAQALLVGSFLGAVGSHTGGSFAILPDRWTRARRGQVFWTASGLCGAAFLLWAWFSIGGQDSFLYEGGFFLVAVAAGCVIVSCVTLPSSLLARFCSLPLLVFIGRISYGVYLYHWPLFLAIDHARTGLSGLGLLVARLAATFLVATVSFFALEEPIRTSHLFRGRTGLVGTGIAAVVTVSALLLATIVPASAVSTVHVTGGLSRTERQSLVAAQALTTRPVRFLLLGDSIALTLGVGLSHQSVSRYGVNVIDQGQLGCDLDTVEVELSGVGGPATPGCTHWRSDWTQDISSDHPDVVGLLIGRWEVSDHLYQGKWVHVGQPAWDQHIASELDQAFDILSGRGAKIVVFTMPYVDPPEEAADGTPFSENDPSRAVAFNRLLRTVVDKRQPEVTLIDLNRQLDPHGHFQSVIDGIQVRWSDGIHITQAGAQWLQPAILPAVGEQGLMARTG